MKISLRKKDAETLWKAAGILEELAAKEGGSDHKEQMAQDLRELVRNSDRMEPV